MPMNPNLQPPHNAFIWDCMAWGKPEYEAYSAQRRFNLHFPSGRMEPRPVSSLPFAKRLVRFLNQLPASSQLHQLLHGDCVIEELRKLVDRRNTNAGYAVAHRTLSERAKKNLCHLRNREQRIAAIKRAAKHLRKAIACASRSQDDARRITRILQEIAASKERPSAHAA